jgi:uncharacterized protein
MILRKFWRNLWRRAHGAQHSVPWSAEGFLMSFSLSNFFFHATTAYVILRHKGAPLGKRDFMGRMKLKG